MSRLALIGFKTASDMASRLCSFAIVLLAVRFLSTEQFGLFSLAWAAGWMVAVGGDFGLQIHLTREVSLRPAEAGQLFSRFLRLRLALCGVVFSAVVSAALLVTRPEHLAAFMLVVLSQIFSSLIEFHNHLYRGLFRSEIESTLNLASRLATLALAAASLFSFGNLLGLAFALSLGNGMAFWAAHLLSARVIRNATAEISSRQEELQIDYRSLLRQILPIGVGILLSAFYFRVDLFFIEQWHRHEPVALYNAVFRLIDALRLLPAAAMAVLFPELCRPGRTRLLALTALVLFGVSIVMASGGFWQASWIVSLSYGDAYLPAVPAFQILLVSLPFLFVNLVLTHQLIAWGMERAYALICAIGLLVSLISNGLLVPSWGINGAASSCAIRELILTGLCLLVLLSQSATPVTSSAAVKSETAR